MYELYAEEQAANGKPQVKESMYRSIFNSEFNLHFHAPRKDTCCKCDAYKTKIEVEADQAKKAVLETEHQVHLRKAEAARKSLKSDGELSKEGNVYVASFDLQKALAFPRLTTSVAYYKRNMYVYNLGIHIMHSRYGVMYMWDETQASRGSQEIASCLVKHIKLYASEFKHIILYSDCCGGQNRNIKVALTLMKLVSCPDVEIETIDHKFLVTGHTYLPNDADFGIIEASVQKTQFIYTASEWYQKVKESKKDPFGVHELNLADFVTTVPLEKSTTNRKTTVDGEAVSWLKIQWICVQNHTI